MADIYELLIFSLASVVFLFIIAKLLGKKQIAQLEFIDYVIGISIGSIAAAMATDTSDRPFYYYLIAITIFFLFDLFVTYISRKGPAMKVFFKGRPTTIIYDGKIDYKQLKKCKIDVNDLLAKCREKGYFDIQDIAYAVFELSGKVSVLPKGPQKPVVIEDIGKKPEQAGFPFHMVIDGKLSKSSLSELKKDEAWLFKQLGIKDKKELKNIIYASYDDTDKKMNIHYKDKDSN